MLTMLTRFQELLLAVLFVVVVKYDMIHYVPEMNTVCNLFILALNFRMTNYRHSIL